MPHHAWSEEQIKNMEQMALDYANAKINRLYRNPLSKEALLHRNRLALAKFNSMAYL